MSSNGAAMTLESLKLTTDSLFPNSVSCSASLTINGFRVPTTFATIESLTLDKASSSAVGTAFWDAPSALAKRRLRATLTAICVPSSNSRKPLSAPVSEMVASIISSRRS